MPNPGDPQSLNRYSYAGNNPLRYVDPSGHWYGPDDYDEAGIENTEEAIAWGIQYYATNCPGSQYCNVALPDSVPLVTQTYNPNGTTTSCGEASATMILNYLGNNITIDEVIAYATENGLFTPNEWPYTSPDNLADLLAYYATVYAGHVKNNDREAAATLRAHISLGIPVIVDVTTSVKAERDKTAHFVVVTALTVDNEVTFNDPYNEGAKTGAGIRQSEWTDFLWAWFNNNDEVFGGHGWYAAVSP